MNLLVIDDEMEICNVFAKAFKSMDVRSAATGASGIKLVKEWSPDAVILDLQLPDIHGVEVLRRIRQIDRKLPVIVLTGYGNGDSIVEAMRLEAYDFLNKPFDLGEIRAMLGRISRDAPGRAQSQENGAAESYENGPIVGKSSNLMEAYKIIGRVADRDMTVFIYGETGTGKELVASLIHSRSRRSKSPFVPVDCTTLSKSLFESQLFGHEKGAFTGADSARSGLFGSAAGGTLFLDEIGNLDLEMQAKLLRVIQEKAFFPVGSTKKVAADVRIIAATNRKPEQAVEEGDLRSDLYYRLNVVPVYLAPLRERREDILLIARYFLEKHSMKPKTLSKEVESVLMEYHWPGNVRELENVIRRVTVATPDKMINPEDLPSEFSGNGNGACRGMNERVDQFRKELILEALKSNGWNQQKAADALEMEVRSVRHYAKKYGLKKC